MKKCYDEPMLEIEKFSFEDILAPSSDDIEGSLPTEGGDLGDSGDIGDVGDIGNVDDIGNI